jgi:excisionase family DNA binding protein
MTDREDANEITVRDAASALRRHPETIRRWVWTGRVAARRQGNRLLLSRADLATVAAGGAEYDRLGLKEWADRLAQLREDRGQLARSASAADLVIGDREARSIAGERDGR